MRIQITEELLTAISSRIAGAVKLAIREVADTEEEKELVAYLLGSTLTLRERILTYLHNTKLGMTVSSSHRRVTVPSEYLRRKLKVSIYQMTDVRSQLLREGRIGVQKTSPLRIRYTEPLAAPALPAQTPRSQR